MENEEKTEKKSEERELDPGEKFLKELDETPYTFDRVGQVYVILRPGLHAPVNKKSDANGENKNRCKQEKDIQ